MRSLLILLPAILMAQAPPARPKAASPKPAAAARALPRKPAAPKPAAPKPFVLTTDTEKTIYAVGLALSQRLTQFDLSPAELEIVKHAISDAAAGKPAVELSTWAPKIQGLVGERSVRLAEREKAASRSYLEKAAAEPGATRSASGLVYRDLTAGTGASPVAADTVKVHYRGTLLNGTEFDSSYKRGEPVEFRLTGVIPCWTEGVQKMKVGGKARLVCPSDLAYGDRGSAPIPGGATLIFEVELLDIVAPPAPAPAAAPPTPSAPSATPSAAPPPPTAK
jgi:FKBP-type peptidyl-prolyl cis-trans isomerase FkpA